MTYLCSPYSDKSAWVRQSRYVQACEAVAKLMRDGEVVFSPICNSHGAAIHGGLPGTWEFWEKVDREFLSICSEVVVLKLPGWEASVGIAAELEIARELGKPIRYMEP